jgi:hypothetical protein
MMISFFLPFTIFHWSLSRLGQPKAGSVSQKSCIFNLPLDVGVPIRGHLQQFATSTFHPAAGRQQGCLFYLGGRNGGFRGRH